jgi:glycosyltransferase involved in cell wall biosynthesis
MALKGDIPSISVITVVKNDLKGLQVTLASILVQSNNNFEWLIVDGCSDDGTSNLGNDLAQKNLARMISVPPKGIYDAMNQGIANAFGDYILFLNAGDFFISQNSIETIERLVKAHNQSLAFPVIQINSNGQAIDIALPTLISSGSRKILDANHQGFVMKKSSSGLCGNFDLSLDFAADGKLMDDVASNDGVTLDSTILTAFVIGGASSLNISKTLEEISTYRGEPASSFQIRKVSITTLLRNSAFEKKAFVARILGFLLIRKARSRVKVKLLNCQELNHWHKNSDSIPNYSCCLSLQSKNG